jgi:hypothetical protein
MQYRLYGDKNFVRWPIRLVTSPQALDGIKKRLLSTRQDGCTWFSLRLFGVGLVGHRQT